jgi:hypothetical protein
MPSYGLLTDSSNEILSEIRKIYDLNFDYVEIGIEGPEGNPTVINKKRYEISIRVSSIKLSVTQPTG